MTYLGDLLEGARPWLGTVSLVGLLGLAVNAYFLARRQNRADKKDDRQGFGALIDALTKEVERCHEHHRECEQRLSRVEAQLEGVHRQMVARSTIEAIRLSPDAVPESAKAITRALDVVTENGPEGETA